MLKTPTNVRSPSGSISTASHGLRSPAGSISSSVASRSGSMDITQSHERESQILPTQCYICHDKFGGDCHSVLQLCDCRVAPCQQCAVNRMILNEGLNLDCMICSTKVDSSATTGIIKNVSKVKDQIERYLERGFRFFKLPVPATSQGGATATVSQYYPLLARYGRMADLAGHLSEFLRTSAPSAANGEDDGGNDAAEAAQKERRKLNVHYLKLQLSRVEYLRGGALGDESLSLGSPTATRRLRSASNDGESDVPGNLTFHVESTALPLGPLAALSLTRNVFLERLLSTPASSGGSGGKDCREINTSCFSCKETIVAGESILFSCNCEMLCCRSCALTSFLSSRNTYRKGIACPCCHKNSSISFTASEKAKEEEASLLEMMVRAYPGKDGHKYSSKSIGDLRKLLEHLYVSGAAAYPAGESAATIGAAIHDMSFHQLELTLSRLYVVIERKKNRHDRIIKKEKKAVTKKAAKEGTDGKEADFDENDMKGKKGSAPGGGAKKGGKKGEAEAGGLDFDRLLYADKEEESYFHAASPDVDRGFDLPLGPLRLLQFRPNPYVELYLANTPTSAADDGLDDPHEREIAELVKMHRFNPFKPKFNTLCPKCSVNPQNLDYMRLHLKTCHEINRKDEIEKFMKLVALDPVPFDIGMGFGGGGEKLLKLPFPPAIGAGAAAGHPPVPPNFNALSLRLSNIAQSFTVQN